MKAEKPQLNISENQLYSPHIKSIRLLIFIISEDTRGYTDLQNLKLHSKSSYSYNFLQNPYLQHNY